MRIIFDGPHDFALKIFSSGINAVSGMSPCPNDAPSRLKWYQRQENLQDYVVTKLQECLDGIMSRSGKAMQLSSGSLEFSANDSMSSLRFEVMPVKAVKFPVRIIRPVTENDSRHYVEYKHVRPSLTTVSAVKSFIQGEERTPIGHQIIKFGDMELYGGTVQSAIGLNVVLTSSIDDCLIHCGVRRDRFFQGASRDKDFVGEYLAMSQKDPAPNYTDEQRVKKQSKRRAKKAGEYTVPIVAKQKRSFDNFEMGSSSGGLIRQTIVKDPIDLGHWDKQKTALFNVHFLHPSRVDRLPTIPEIPVVPEVVETPKNVWSISRSIGRSIGEKLKSISPFKSQRKPESKEEEKPRNQEGEEVVDDGKLSKNHPVVTLDDPTLKQPFLMISELEAQLNLAWMSELSSSYPIESIDN